MTREKAIAHGKEQLEVFGGEHAEFIKLAIEVLEQEPCEDCVSRQDIYFKLTNGEYPNETIEQFIDRLVKELKALPSVTPIRPKGHWICDGKGRSFADYHCSECGLKLALCGQDIKQRQDSGYSLFCSGCGADMREVVEE